MIKIDPIQSKLQDKNYRCYRKSCLRMENHANGMTHLPTFVVPFDIQKLNC
jgi:hypothetical protein